MSALPLSIAICSIRPIHIFALLASLLPQLESLDQVLVIFDLRLDAEFRRLFALRYGNRPVETHYNGETRGLSYCRNLSLHKAKHPYLIFFDDDVLLPPCLISRYRELFAQGCQVLGGPLKLPSFYPQLPFWLPEGFSSLLGVHTFQKRIWGGNFGFHRETALKHDLDFQEDLGRKGQGLQSGDETDFLQRYASKGGVIHFDEALTVYHCIDIHRFTFPYLLRRAFWQGRSEVRKKSVFTGLKKELSRAIPLSSASRRIRCCQSIIGLLLFLMFCLGVALEAILHFRKM